MGGGGGGRGEGGGGGAGPPAPEAEPPPPPPPRPPRGRAPAARLARIFGEVLPETTGDERGEDRDTPSSTDDWLRSQVPPHHG
ncbi:hypothetical protein [Nocardia cyriacigeorgica]|uniref:hypothetical protein n=1 Tax=Nocardia cyriacigeorgica TaxID=135487 RepID=UPI003CC7C80D